MDKIIDDFKKIAGNKLLSSSKIIYDNIIHLHKEQNIKGNKECYESCMKQVNTNISQSSKPIKDIKISYHCIEPKFATKFYPIYVTCKQYSAELIPFAPENIKHIIYSYHEKNIYINKRTLNIIEKFIDNTPHNRVCYIMFPSQYCLICYLPIIKGDKDMCVLIDILMLSRNDNEKLKTEITIDFSCDFKQNGKPDKRIKDIHPFYGFYNYRKNKNNKVCKTCKCNIYSTSIKCDKCQITDYCSIPCKEMNNKIHGELCEFIKKTHNKSHYMNRWCANCKEFNIKAKSCSQCKLVYYCNADCQKKNWKHHKTLCKAIREEEEKIPEKIKNNIKKNPVKQDIEIMKQDNKIIKQDIEITKQDIEIMKQDNKIIKQDIEITKQDIEIMKQDIEIMKQQQHIQNLAQLKKQIKELLKEQIEDHIQQIEELLKNQVKKTS